MQVQPEARIEALGENGGGGPSRIERLYRNVPLAMRRHVFAAGSPEPPHVHLVASAHGDASGVRGAAWLWRDA